MFLFSKEKGIYRVIIGIGNEMSEGYLQKLAGGKEGAVKLANFAALSGFSLVFPTVPRKKFYKALQSSSVQVVS